MTRDKQKYFIVIKSRESSKLFTYQEGQKRLNIYVLAEKIRAKLEFFKQALRGSTLPSAVSFSSLWILHTLCLT